MISVILLDQKDFMNRLLLGNTFDTFWLSKASITTYNTFTIDGALHKEFFDDSVQEELTNSRRTFSFWKEVKPFCFSLIRGKQPPLHFQIVFQLSKTDTEKAIKENGVSQNCEDISAFYLNLQYRNGILTCTTGTSLRVFTLDKTLDLMWDNMVFTFFKQQKIAFQQL